MRTQCDNWLSLHFSEPNLPLPEAAPDTDEEDQNADNEGKNFGQISDEYTVETDLVAANYKSRPL